MVIKSKTGVYEHAYQGDLEIFRHFQDVRPAQFEAQQSRDNLDKSFVRDRMAWPVACVPELLFKQFEVNGNVDWEKFDRWLGSDYGAPFRAFR